MKTEKLITLLAKLESANTQSGESQDFENLSDSFAMQIRGGYGENTNAACSGNTGCYNNESCNGNASCNANSACGANSGCSANETCN